MSTDDDGSRMSTAWNARTPKSRVGRAGTPSTPCRGKTVIRYKHDEIGHRKGDPVLDSDGARTYRPCESWGANGTDLCFVHGGASGSTIADAKRKLAAAADEMAETLRLIANDERLPAETRLKAAATVLDRVGIKTGVDVSLETPGWQKAISAAFGIPIGNPEPADEPSEAAAKLMGPPAEVPGDGLADHEEPRPAKAAPRKAAKKATRPASKAPKFEGW